MTFDSVDHSVKTLKKFLDELKNNLKHVCTNMKTYNQTCDELRGTIDTPLTCDYLDKVDLSFNLENTLRKDIKSIQSKLNMVEPIKNKHFFFKE